MGEAVRWGGIENEDGSILFEKAVPVRVTSPYCDDRHDDLTLRFLLGISKQQNNSGKVLQVQITSETDPFFLYYLDVNDNDFESLKTEQCIVVDFATFPYKLIELLEHCIETAGSGTSRDCVKGKRHKAQFQENNWRAQEKLELVYSDICGPITPNSVNAVRFIAVLNLQPGDSTFSIVEMNQFKHLSYLCLCFKQGNDTTVKNYLAGRLLEFKASNTSLSEKLKRTLDSLDEALRDKDNLNSKIVELKKSNSQSISELKAEHALMIAREKDKALRDLSELKEKIEKERADLEIRHSQQLKLQQDRVAELDSQVRTLLDNKRTLEESLSEAESTVAVVVKDTDKKLQDKDDLISNLKLQLDSLASHCAALEDSQVRAKEAADRAEEKAAIQDAEVTNCNQTIEKLQVELRSCKMKIKLKSQVATQQGTLLLEKQVAIEKASNENKMLKEENLALEADKESLQRKVEDLEVKFSKLYDIHKSDRQMVQWLNEQLTEAQLGKLNMTSCFPKALLSSPALSFASNSDLTTKGFSEDIESYLPALASPSPSPCPEVPQPQSDMNSCATPQSVMFSAQPAEDPMECHTVASRPLQLYLSNGDGGGGLQPEYKQMTPSADDTVGTMQSISSGGSEEVLSAKEDINHQTPRPQERPRIILPRPQLSFATYHSSFLSGSL